MAHVLPTLDPVNTQFLEIKVKPTVEEKKLFKAAADAVKPFPLSLGKWLLLAGLEKLERDGFLDQKKKGAK